MNKNVGGIDRILRIILGIVIIVVGYLNHSWWGLVGLVPLITGLTNFCPNYLPFKASTAEKKDSNA